MGHTLPPALAHCLEAHRCSSLSSVVHSEGAHKSSTRGKGGLSSGEAFWEGIPGSVRDLALDGERRTYTSAMAHNGSAHKIPAEEGTGAERSTCDGMVAELGDTHSLANLSCPVTSFCFTRRVAAFHFSQNGPDARVSAPFIQAVLGSWGLGNFDPKVKKEKQNKMPS